MFTIYLCLLLSIYLYLLILLVVIFYYLHLSTITTYALFVFVIYYYLSSDCTCLLFDIIIYPHVCIKSPVIKLTLVNYYRTTPHYWDPRQMLPYSTNVTLYNAYICNAHYAPEQA